MKLLVFMLFCLWTLQGIAQQSDNCFETMFKEGMDDYNKKEYYQAYIKFRAARYGCKLKNKTEEDKADYWMNEANSQYANALKIALTDAENEKENAKTEQKKADSLLQVVDEIRRAMETACFKKSTSIKTKHDNYSIDEFEKIDTLDLSDNDLRRLPKEVEFCKNLKQINLFGNPNLCWKNTFELFLKLPYLEKIKIETHYFDSIPLELYDKIQELNLKNSNLIVLPKNIFQLKNLKKLNVASNLLKFLPTEIKQLSNLEYLDLKYNQIEVLPKEITELQKLNTLNMIYNDLHYLPEDIAKLKELKDLDLTYNQLKKLPKQIGDLKNLTSLDLSSNKLEKLPIEIGCLKNLTTLILDFNKLHNLPKEIALLTNLTDLSVNDIDSLPDEVLNLKLLNGQSCGNCCSIFLNNKAFKQALLLAQRGIEKDSTQTWIYRKLAISYLFTNQYENASSIVQKWKGKVDNEKTDFSKQFENELDLMRLKGITHPDMPKIRKLLEE